MTSTAVSTTVPESAPSAPLPKPEALTSSSTTTTSELASYEWYPHVHRRPVQDMDLVYFKYNICKTTVIVSGDMTFRPTPKRIATALHRAILTTPILCTTIVGDAENGAHFEVVPSVRDLPQLHAEIVDKTEDVDPTTERLCREAVVKAEEEPNWRYPAKFFGVVGPKRSSLGMVINHSFLDGMGISSFIPKFFLYFVSPKVLWKVYDRQNEYKIPSIMEMMLKADYPKFQAQLQQNTVVPKSLLVNHLFPQFQPHSQPNFEQTLRVFEGDISAPSVQTMKDCRDVLRKSGVTITTALGALAAKVALRVATQEQQQRRLRAADPAPQEKKEDTNEDGNNNNDDDEVTGFVPPADERKSIMAIATAMDARSLGLPPKPKKRTLKDKITGKNKPPKTTESGQKKSKAKMFPPAANYSFTALTELPADTLASAPLVDIAQKVRKDLKRIQSDPEYRFQRGRMSTNDEADLRCLIGCSSMNIPVKVFTPKNFRLTFESDTLWPKVWFVISTYFRTTTIRVESCLPVADHMSAEELGDAMMEAIVIEAKGTALEALFPEGTTQVNRGARVK